MAAWSSLGLKTFSKCNLTRAFSSVKNKFNAEHEIKNAINHTLVRSHNTMHIVPSRFAWNKFKDMMNFYLLLGIVPLTLVITYCNVFIGPATLAVIPEGYEPKPWEYHSHPITRFFAKYITQSPQENHERNLHNIFYQNERYLIRQLEKKIETFMAQRQDYQAYYMSPRSAKYSRQLRDIHDRAQEDIIQSHGNRKLEDVCSELRNRYYCKYINYAAQ